MDKEKMRELISEVINLKGSRLKESEYDELYDVVKHPDDYIGNPKSYSSTHRDFSSDGKYTREETTTYRIREKDGKLVGEEEHHYIDDDGTSGSFKYVYDLARDVMHVARILKGDDYDDQVRESKKALDRRLTERTNRLYQEQCANNSENNENQDKDNASGTEINEAVAGLLIGIAKDLPKVISFIKRNVIPAAKEVGTKLTNKDNE